MRYTNPRTLRLLYRASSDESAKMAEHKTASDIAYTVFQKNVTTSLTIS